jgi:murein DD-endopeptidase MepM/ murein hydrolase activator NlpD
MQRMRLASGVIVCLAAAALTLAAAAPVRADAAATHAAATTAVATSTDASSAATATTTADPSSAPEPAATTDAGTEPDTVAPTPTDAGPAIPVAQPIDRGCVFGSVLLLLPNHAPVAIGPVADAPSVPVAAASNLVYPADGSVVKATEIALEGTGCDTGHSAGGKAELDSLSLFAGSITADHVGLTIGDAGARHSDVISGLEVDGTAVQAEAGTKVPVGGWGYLVTGTLEHIRTTAASGTPQPPLRVQASALAVHLLESHSGLPAGTVLLISFAGLPGPATPAEQPMPLQPATPVKVTPLQEKRATTSERGGTKHKGPLHHAPWPLTPPLGSTHYVFPVTGHSSFGDTYGGFRSDVPGNWHHGDDIFAPLGTPVVAVADGTVNRVGWQKIGGWRIWVDDKDGNRFYYAHLSGYTRAVIRSKQVKAGQVIGFVGNSGDAITTPPHLHFEIHPNRFSKWGYDGAVDPTRYLEGWSRLLHVHAPRPAHPRLPKAEAARQEARYVFRELLAARGLLKKPAASRDAPPPQPVGPVLPPASKAAAVFASAPEVTPVAHAAPQALPTTTMMTLVGVLLTLLALSGSTLAVRRRKRPVALPEADVVHVPAVAPPLELPAALHETPRAASVPPVGPAPRGVPLSVVAGTGALLTMSVLLLHRRSARRHAAEL